MAAEAKPLVVVNVAAPAINCVYNTGCQVTVTDSLGTIPVPSVSGTSPWPDAGPAVLQSRTYLGGSGSVAAGETAYEYRLVMAYAVGSACVSALKVDVGTIKRHYYDFTGTLADVYVVTVNAVGTIGLKSAEQDGGTVTFTFAKPVCAGPAAQKGDQSFFFGFTAAGSPKAGHGAVELVGGRGVTTDVRMPQH